MKDRVGKYEYYIDRIVAENQIKPDEILIKKSGESITVKDFVEKTKQMRHWHRRLLSNHYEEKLCSPV